jgi:ubiquinone/menaquinone biosynthesis C-methylase UbiE
MSDSGIRKESVLDANQQVHDYLADIYDSLHSELYNACHIERKNADLDLVGKYFGGGEVRMLDAACGTGFMTVLAARRPNFKITAVDISGNSILKLEEKAARLKLSNIRCETADISAFVAAHKGDGYDLITLNEALHHFFNYTEILTALCSIVKPGGMIYIGTERLLPDEIENSSRFHSLCGDAYAYSMSVISRLRLLLTKFKLIGFVNYDLSDYSYFVEKSISLGVIGKVLKDLGWESRAEKFNLSAPAFLMNRLNAKKVNLNHFTLFAAKQPRPGFAEIFKNLS